MTLLEPVLTASFEAGRKKLLKRYPLAESAIQKALGILAACPETGDAYPGFAPAVVRKTRLGLARYGIGARRGLRLLHLARPDKGKIAFLLIYKKGDFKTEAAVKASLVQALREYLGLAAD